MDRKIIILPVDDDLVYEKRLLHDDERHVSGCIEFMNKYGIVYDGLNVDSGHVVGVYLASLGNCVLQIDDTTVFYLPEEFQEFQYRWLKRNKRMIRQFPLFSIVNFEDNHEIREYEKYSLDISLYQKFVSILEEKPIHSLPVKERRK